MDQFAGFIGVVTHRYIELKPLGNPLQGNY